jgi:hypothetical protein
MERAVRTGARRGYGAAVADLWERLGAALTRLERMAEASPEEIVAEGGQELPGLQYSLHAASELALGIDPPPGALTVHAELVSALEQGRDTTAEIAEAVDDLDEELVEQLLPEWRGALFRVRLARLRAVESAPARTPEPEPPPQPEPAQLPSTALAATGLVLAGALLFTAGAVLAEWPLWAAGLALFGGGFILFRP